MNRQQILTELYLSPEVNDCIGKMNPPHLRDDLKGELFLVLAETPEEKLILLYEKRELKFYVVRIILNMIQSSTSPFFRKYRNYQLSYDEITEKRNKDLIVVERQAEYDLPLVEATKKLNSYISQSSDCDIDIHQFEKLFEERLNEVERILNSFHWYDAELFRLYVKEGSIRKVEKLIDIPRASIHNTIKKVKAAILSQLC